MIGRFTQQGAVRTILTNKEFYMIAIGAFLVAISYVLDNMRLAHLPAALISLAALVLLGGPIIAGAARGLWKRQGNVDELVSIAVLACVVTGEILPAAAVSLVMRLGSLLEKLTTQHARSAVEDLLRLTPAQAVVLKDGVEIAVPLHEVGLDDQIVIRPGERIPVDGPVVRGLAAVNQASLTGEYLPVDKEPGDSVYAGTVIHSGMLVVQAKKVGESTTLGKMIQLMHEAEQLRAPILRVADRYAGYFSPLVIGLSVLVFLFTKDINRAITILIVGCPCAFILAAPVAVTAGMGNAARNGVLIKGGALLEELGRINAVVFDKTGTLTTGRPVLEETIARDGFLQDDVLRLAASAEKYSEHPLARAILAAAAGLSLTEPEDFIQIPGRGVKARIDDAEVFIGTACELDAGGDAADVLKTGLDTHLVVKVDGRIAGYLLIADTVRPEARSLVGELHQLGVRMTKLLTGDGRGTALQVAQTCGITEIEAELLPDSKLQQIRGLQEQGYKVAMVGDGINDSPSLAAADIGLAMGAMGTDIAIESAGIALMNDDLTKIPYLLKLGKATLKTINFNIAFAMVFNAAAIIASGLGYLNPVLGAITHNCGSVLVVFNSVLLFQRRF